MRILLRSRLLKDIIDRTGAVFGLIITAPIFLIVAVILKAQGQKIFFIQDRVGLNLEPFGIIKFTTMVEGSENHGTITTSSDNRITLFGKILRKFKLNELPQLINIIKGEMSFVGPRPLARNEVEKYYKPEVRRRIYSVKPGITGRGSMEFSDEEDQLDEVDDFEEYFATEIMPKKAELEIRYVDNWNIILDMEIFLGTIYKLLKTFARYLFYRLVRRKGWPGKVKTY